MCPEAQLGGRSAAEVFLLLGVSSCDVSPSCHLLTPPQAAWSQWLTVLALRAVEIRFGLFLGSITGPPQSVSTSQPTVTSGMAVAAMEEAVGAGWPLLHLTPPLLARGYISCGPKDPASPLPILPCCNFLSDPVIRGTLQRCRVSLLGRALCEIAEMLPH